jgi:hypothetical protein
MTRAEKFITFLGVVNFFILMMGIKVGIPKEIPHLLIATGVTPFQFREVLVQLIVLFPLFSLPGFLFVVTFFPKVTKIEKTLLSFLISSLLFGIYDFLGAGALTPPKFYSIVKVHTLSFIVFFSLLGVLTFFLKKLRDDKVVRNRTFYLIFVILSIILGFSSFGILKAIPFENLVTLQKIIPWWFNPPCICSEANFLVLISSLIIIFFLSKFIATLKEKAFLSVPISLLLAFIFLALSKLQDLYHGILAFGSPTGLVWNPTLATGAGIAMFFTLLFFLFLTWQLYKIVRKI